MAAANHQKPTGHLEGFFFPKGQSPMECKQHIRTILQQRTYMPGKKDRGNADSFLRFETNLRVIFEAVKHWSNAWGHRNFWVEVRSRLDFHHNTTEDDLDEIVHRYCDGRRAFCRSESLDLRHLSSEPPNRIASLADFVIGLSGKSPYEFSFRELQELGSSWKSQLHGALHSQGVLSSQLRDGTCAPELLPQKGAKMAATTSPATRDTIMPKGPRGSVSRTEPTLHVHRQLSDLSSRISFDKDHCNPTPDYSPSTQYTPGLHSKANWADEHDERAEHQPGGNVSDAIHAGPKPQPNRIQSLDELVTDYSSGWQLPVSRTMDPAADFKTNMRKRHHADDGHDNGLSPKRLAIDTNMSTPLNKSSADFVSSLNNQSSDTPRQIQAQIVPLSGQNKDIKDVMDTIGDITRVDNTGLNKLLASNSDTTPQTDNIPTKNIALPLENDIANNHGGKCTLGVSSGGEPKHLPNPFETPDQGLGKRLQDLENRQHSVDNLLALIRAMESQLAQLSFGQDQISSLESKVEDLSRQLAMRHSDVQRVTRLESMVKELTDQSSQRLTEQKRFNNLELMVKELADQSSQRLTEQQRFNSLELMVKELQDQLIERSSTQRISQDVDTQLRDMRQHIDQQATKFTNTTETRFSLLQEQLRQQTAAQAMLQSPHPLDSDSIGNTDVKGFLSVLTSEMVKIRSSMKARIRDMDAAGEPDDEKKYAISDISYELGRVIELAKKRIQTL